MARDRFLWSTDRAHQMYGTTVSHVVRWLLVTLWRSLRFMGAAGREFPRLRRLTWLAVGFVAIAAVAVIGTFVWLEQNGLPFDAAIWTFGGGAGVIALSRYALRYLWQAPLLDFVGDAARYFDVNPKNVARRYDILRGGEGAASAAPRGARQKGRSGLYRYGRIVVVGHSLGSVIAYDLIRHYWGELNGFIPVDKNADEIKGVEGFALSKQDVPRDVTPDPQLRLYWSAQQTLWKAIRDRVPSGEASLGDATFGGYARRFAPTEVRSKQATDHDRPPDWQPARWLVSDLVTLGSPLAHAPVLLAAGRADLKEKLGLRELPMRPPDRSKKSVNIGHYTVDLAGEKQVGSTTTSSFTTVPASRRRVGQTCGIPMIPSVDRFAQHSAEAFVIFTFRMRLSCLGKRTSATGDGCPMHADPRGFGFF